MTEGSLGTLVCMVEILGTFLFASSAKRKTEKSDGKRKTVKGGQKKKA
jgi:hypothetical protein